MRLPSLGRDEWFWVSERWECVVWADRLRVYDLESRGAKVLTCTYYLGLTYANRPIEVQVSRLEPVVRDGASFSPSDTNL